MRTTPALSRAFAGYQGSINFAFARKRRERRPHAIPAKTVRNPAITAPENLRAIDVRTLYGGFEFELARGNFAPL